ncbi:MAG: recombination protein RecR [Clostridia bacterium]|nr:recombination protein RecR [Oscillospiraceae bacterium]MBR2410975.1 recombination protein RecR [Clostridia bacterium]
MESAVSFEKLTEQFRKMPGIGSKTAMRLAFYVLSLSKEEAGELSDVIREASEKIHRCPICCNLTDEDICPVCKNTARKQSVICVVENVEALMAIENTNEYNGTYHVLHGVISPLDDVSPDDIAIKELLSRIEEGGIEEVIMATGSNVEGELTAMYISKLLKPLGVIVSRLAYGLPVGSDLQYADSVTLMRAIEGRKTI